MPDETRDHNVYILGAGFSSDAGAPLINDFLDRSREFFDNPDSVLDSAETQLIVTLRLRRYKAASIMGLPPHQNTRVSRLRGSFNDPAPLEMTGCK
jgi:hypothetical protein